MQHTSLGSGSWSVLNGMRRYEGKKMGKKKSKKLSNPFSTGGGGGHFEAQVQASFVALMLTAGSAPCIPNLPISKIKLQGKFAGYDTDDLIIFVEKPSITTRLHITTRFRSVLRDFRIYTHERGIQPRGDRHEPKIATNKAARLAQAASQWTQALAQAQHTGCDHECR